MGMRPRRPRDQELNVKEESSLSDVGLMTLAIRECEEMILSLAAKRRKKVNYLVERGFTFVRIAQACGVSENAVYKIMRDTKREM